MAKRMDDEGLRPRPLCSSCLNTVASWLVSSGPRLLGGPPATVKMCTGCAKTFPAKRRRALRASDY